MIGRSTTCRLARLYVLLAAAAASASAPAQGGTWYTVELIIFERTGSAGVSEEHWEREPGDPVFDGAIELIGAGDLLMDDDPELANSAFALAFQLLDKDLQSMQGIRRALERSSLYNPLLHVAWRQPGFGKGEARAVLLRSPGGEVAAPAASASQPGDGNGDLDLLGLIPLGSTDTGMVSESDAAPVEPADAYVEGTVRMHRSRYLHVETDLLYYRPSLTPAAVRSAGQATNAAIEDQPPQTRFRLVTSRRMRSNELHYVDHPVFGMLVLVTPYQAGAPQASAAEPEARAATLDGG